MVQSPSSRRKKAHNEYHFVPSGRKTKSSPLTWPKNGPSLPPGLKALLLCLTLSVLLSVCGVGCGAGQPPVKTLDQWQAESERVRSRGD
jgi:hypothetical protein